MSLPTLMIPKNYKLHVRQPETNRKKWLAFVFGKIKKKTSHLVIYTAHVMILVCRNEPMIGKCDN